MKEVEAKQPKHHAQAGFVGCGQLGLGGMLPSSQQVTARCAHQLATPQRCSPARMFLRFLCVRLRWSSQALCAGASTQRTGVISERWVEYCQDWASDWDPIRALVEEIQDG